MHYIISPAKTMNVVDDMPWQGKPRFLDHTRRLVEALKALSYDEAKTVWACSDALASLNYERVRAMTLDEEFSPAATPAMLAPAILAYEGIQYQNMAPGVMTASELDYIQEHLRILSGFYGVLAPFDAVTPYRLEMQAKLTVDGHKDLYSFWGSALYESLAAETDLVVNLASVEYARAVTPFFDGGDSDRPPASQDARPGLLTCLFGSVNPKTGKLVQRSTAAKAARGTFVRWCAEHAVSDPAEFVRFDVAGYRYDESLSTPDTLAFVC